MDDINNGITDDIQVGVIYNAVVVVFNLEYPHSGLAHVRLLIYRTIGGEYLWIL